MPCIVINFITVFILDTSSIDTAIKLECIQSPGSENTEHVFVLMSQDEQVDIASYNKEKQIYNARIKQ